jgi:hypothetical protein
MIYLKCFRITWRCWLGVAVLLCTLIGCSHNREAPRTVIWPEKQGKVEAFIGCRDSFTSVRVAFTDSLDAQSHPAEIALSEKEQASILAALRGLEATGDMAMTPPPWPVVFIFENAACGQWVATLVGHDRLRFNAENPRSARIVGEDQTTPVATEAVIPDSAQTLWNLLEGKLGETRVKQYRLDF